MMPVWLDRLESARFPAGATAGQTGTACGPEPSAERRPALAGSWAAGYRTGAARLARKHGRDKEVLDLGAAWGLPGRCLDWSADDVADVYATLNVPANGRG